MELSIVWPFVSGFSCYNNSWLSHEVAFVSLAFRFGIEFCCKDIPHFVYPFCG